MRRFALLLGLTVVIAACAIAVSAPEAKAGCTVGFFAECHGDNVLLNWNIAYPYPCTANVLSILRRPATSRTWTTIVSNPTGDHYTDVTPPPVEGGYYYRLVLAEQCPLATLSIWDVGPIDCW